MSSDTEISKFWGNRYTYAEFETRLAVVPSVRREVLAEAGHMLHHDQPAEEHHVHNGRPADAVLMGKALMRRSVGRSGRRDIGAGPRRCGPRCR